MLRAAAATTVTAALSTTALRRPGAVSIEYMDGSYAPDRSSQVSLLLAKLTAAGGGNQFQVVRG